VRLLPEYDMTRTFNLGVGLIFIVDKKNVDAVIRLLKRKKAMPAPRVFHRNRQVTKDSFRAGKTVCDGGSGLVIEMPVQNWAVALSHLSIMFEKRLVNVL
jgi:hypothetical protein